MRIHPPIVAISLLLLVTANVAAESKYDLVQPLSEGLSAFRETGPAGKWGFIDAASNIVVAAKFDWLGPFNNGLAPYQLDKKRGFLDKSGKEVIPARFDDVTPFMDGIANQPLAQVRVNSSNDYAIGFINTNGDEVVPVTHKKIDLLPHGIAKVNHLGKEGFYYVQKENVTPPKLYDYIEGFHVCGGSDVSRVRVDGKWGFIDQAGREIRVEFDAVEVFQENRARVRKGDKLGYINKKGEAVVPIKYDSLSDFAAGLAQARAGAKWGFIDNTGKVIIDLKYDEITGFTYPNKLAQARVGGEILFIDRSGKEIPIRNKVNIVGTWMWERSQPAEDGLPVYDRNNYKGDLMTIVCHANGKLDFYVGKKIQTTTSWTIAYRTPDEYDIMIKDRVYEGGKVTVTGDMLTMNATPWDGPMVVFKRLLKQE